jgi:hypothetical protein
MKYATKLVIYYKPSFCLIAKEKEKNIEKLRYIFYKRFLIKIVLARFFLLTMIDE